MRFFSRQIAILLMAMVVLFWLSTVPAYAKQFISDGTDVSQSIDVDIGGHVLFKTAVSSNFEYDYNGHRYIGGSAITSGTIHSTLSYTPAITAEWHLPYIRDGGSVILVSLERKLLTRNAKGFATVAIVPRC